MALNDAVAPPAVQPVAPVATGNIPRVEIREEPNVHEQYVNAVNSGDPQEMARVANNAKGTDVQPLADTAVKIMGGNDTRLSQITAPVIKQGGINTPEGRIAAAKVFEDQSDKPQWLRAIGEKLMGNPNARLFITGGTPKTEITYDDQGRQLEETRNELGKRLSVKDVGTGQLLTNEEYQLRGGGITDREQALGRIAKKSMQAFNVEAANKADVQAMDYGAAAPEMRDLASQNTFLHKELMQSNLDPTLKAQIASFTSRQIGDSQSVNNGFNALDQFTRSRGVGMDNQQKAAAKAAAEALGLTLGSDGSITDSKNVKVDRSRLDQLQQSYSSNRNFEQNFTQTKQDAINSGLYGKMTFEQQKTFDQILLNNKRLEQKTSELISKHGTPSFVINPAAPGPFDAFSLGAGQSVLSGFNAMVTEEYAAWRKKQVEDMRARGQVPQAGELENAFIRTAKYQQLRRDAEEQSWSIKKQIEGYVKASPVSQSPVGGMAPENISNATAQKLPAAPSAKANREEEIDSLAAKHRK
jgi:hypothetical protein